MVIHRTPTSDDVSQPPMLPRRTSIELLIAAAVISGMLICGAWLGTKLQSGHRLAAMLLFSLPAGVVAFALARYLGQLKRLRALVRDQQDRTTRSRDRFAGIIRSSMEAIITIDEGQRIVLFNPMAEILFGYREQDVIGKSIEGLIPEKFRDAHRGLIVRFGATGVTYRLMGKQRIVFALHADGHEFPIEASISQLEDGGTKLFTVMLRDITDRVRASDALKRAQEELRYLADSVMAAREEERQRVAHDLDEILARRLSAVREGLHSVASDLDASASTECLDRIDAMQEAIDAAADSIRRISADLRPPLFDEFGLVPAIEWIADEFRRRHHLVIRVRAQPCDLDGSTAIAVFRIVQEALSNVVHHAQASRVHITLRQVTGDCALSILDNGKGSDAIAEPRTRRGLGLIGIRERARLLGGTAQTARKSHGGFCVSVTFPSRHSTSCGTGNDLGGNARPHLAASSRSSPC